MLKGQKKKGYGVREKLYDDERRRLYMRMKMISDQELQSRGAKQPDSGEDYEKERNKMKL